MVAVEHQVTDQKARGAYYTPPETAAALVRWAVRDPDEHMLDPSCGDGRFLALHPRSTGVDCDETAVSSATEAAPSGTVECADFFDWAASTTQRFDCAAGNPPFIRYQRFTGETRRQALRLCATLGAKLSGLSSSWAPYLIVTASLLRPGGRMAFVVPAEIGHAPYAAPVLDWFAGHFDDVQLVAVRQKLFADLSEDVWLLYADGFGGRTGHFDFALHERFVFRSEPPLADTRVSVREWRRWGSRLRPMLLPGRVRDAYERLRDSDRTTSLGRVADVGIGYVSGANDFFHLRPSEADELGMPGKLFRPTVRSGRELQGGAITEETVAGWRENDRPNFLLALGAETPLPDAVRRYLDSDTGKEVRQRYKCRVRTPWYAVPHVYVPDLFLSYMSGKGPALVENRARCTCTNAVHGVRLNGAGVPASRLRRRWDTALTRLSCEVEGHPLGGGVLKLEPREALNVLVCLDGDLNPGDERDLREGVEILRRWRHRG